MPDSDRDKLSSAVTALLLAVLAVLIALIIWDCAASYTQHRVEAEHYAASYAAKTQEGIEQCATLINDADIAECIVQVVEASREHQRGEYDLNAQRDMAEWAGWLLVASWLGVLITAVGIYYVRNTLLETRRIGQAQVRAYIGIKSAAIYFTTELGIPIVEITAVNTGQSPTTEFSWGVELQYYADGEEVLLCPPDGIDRPDIDIGAMEESKLMPVIARKFALVEQIAKWTHKPEKVGISVIIHFRWRDVFGETWQDQASFFGVGKTRDANTNRTEISDINSSPWFCKLNRIAKGAVRPDIVVGVKKLSDEDEANA